MYEKTFIFLSTAYFKILHTVWFSLQQATSWENLFMPYTNNKGADQPVHPHSLISAFVVCCLDSITPLVVIFDISRLSS